MLNDDQIQLAKQRIWTKLQANLPERGVSVYQPVLTLLRSSQELSISRLKQVQLKERFLDLLPDRKKQVPLLSRRFLATASLVFILGVFFTPGLQVAPSATAASSNILEVVEGEVFVNGVLIEDSFLIQAGDVVSTGEGAMAHLYFVDDTRITLGPRTQVDIVDTKINPENRAKTTVEVHQDYGRVWVQVLNLVAKESTFTLDFTGGEVVVDSRASFDVRVGEDTQVSVARNIVRVQTMGEETSYEGILGQGAFLLLGEDLKTGPVDSEVSLDVWWDFNLAYGKSYARRLDENYKKEAVSRAVILPGSPFYFLKTFRESLQVALSFSSSAREDVLVQHAENRLNEAQVLLAQGQTEAAEATLEVYQETVATALQNSDNKQLLAALEETQKQVTVDLEVDANTTLLQDHLTESSALVASNVSDKTEMKLNSASQKLERVPDLLGNGHFEQALTDLSSYQEASLSIVSELENVPLEQREVLVSALLNQKLEDIQMLRVIGSMPELSAVMDVNGATLEQLSMMVLSLSEQELSELSTFIETTDYDTEVQYETYTRLKDHAELTPELTEQFQDVEEELSSVEETQVVADLELIPHADEPQDESESGN